MAYFVIGDDGQKYGPADVATLNQWISEARLIPSQILEDETSGQRTAASAVQGLNFPVAAQQPPPGAPLPGSHGYQGSYSRSPTYGDAGQSDVTQAWVFAGLSLICCAPITSWLAFNAARRAEVKGAQNVQGPRILAIVGLVLFVILFVVRLIVIKQAISSGQLTNPTQIAPPVTTGQ